MKKLIHEGFNVVTTPDLAAELGVDTASLTKNFNNNKDRYEEGKHYFLLQGADLALYIQNLDMQISSKTRSLYLWTEKGAFNHVKSLGSDEAWSAYENLVDTYFRARAIADSSTKSTHPAVSTLDFLQSMLDGMRMQDARLLSVEKDVKQLVAQTKTRPEYYTIVGYASLHGIEMGLKLAANLGKKCTAVCRMRNYPMEELPDPRFGRVKTYPYHVLEEVFNLNIV